MSTRTATAAPLPATKPNWRYMPSADDLAAAYPQKAQAARVEGKATIECVVAVDGRLSDCKLVQEAPPGYGFGAAALSLAPNFQMDPAIRDGAPQASRARIPIVFKLPPQPADQSAPQGVLAGAALSGAVFVAALALLAANDWLRIRSGAPRVRVVRALSNSLGLVWRTWAAAPVPLILVALFTIGDLAWGTLAGPDPERERVLSFAFMPLALMLMGACYRVALAGRAAPADTRIRRFGLQFGQVEGRVFLAQLIMAALLLGVAAVMAVLGFLGVAIVGRLSGGDHYRPLVSGTVVAVAAFAGLYLLGRLFSLAPAMIVRTEAGFADAWNLGRGAAFAGMIFWLAYGVMLLLPIGAAFGVLVLLHLGDSLIAIWALNLASVLALAAATPFLAGLGGDSYLQLAESAKAARTA